METIKKLLEENQWSRPSPSLMDPETNMRAPTCPICTIPKRQGHDKECWLGLVIELLKEQSTRTTTEIAQLKSRVAGLQVNRDALFGENERFRADLAAKDKELKELRSMHEGKMDAADEVIYQQKLKLQNLVEEVKHQRRRANNNEAQLVWLAGWCKEKFGVESNDMIGKEDWPNELVKVVAKVVDEAIAGFKSELEDLTPFE